MAEKIGISLQAGHWQLIKAIGLNLLVDLQDVLALNPRKRPVQKPLPPVCGPSMAMFETLASLNSHLLLSAFPTGTHLVEAGVSISTNPQKFEHILQRVGGYGG